MVRPEVRGARLVTRYVVRMRRSPHLPLARGFWTVNEAADYIIRHGKAEEWTIGAQGANQITASTPCRDLHPGEWAQAVAQGVRRPYDPWASQIRRAVDE
jgi:hypothetical protein